MAEHVGIVACSISGAVPRYQPICMGGEEVFGETHARPAVSMYTHPFDE